MTDTDDDQDEKRHRIEQNKVWKLEGILKGLQILVAVARPKDMTPDDGEDLCKSLQDLHDLTKIVLHEVGDDNVNAIERLERLQTYIFGTVTLVKDRFPMHWA